MNGQEPTLEIQEHAISIDHYWYVPAGDRDTNSKNWRKYHPGDENIPVSPYRVFLAHGGPSAIGELFLFGNKKDAVWFFTEGHRGMLFVDDDGVIEDVRAHMDTNFALSTTGERCDSPGEIHD